MQRIRAVREIAGEYDAVLCDVWGVIHDGRTVFEGVLDVLAALREAGSLVVLLSNVPRPGSALPVELRRRGVPDEAWDGIVTSGDAIRLELARRAPGPMHRLGRATDTALWEGLGLELADANRARFAAIAGLRGADETPAAYAEALAGIRGRDLELLCANPDRQVPVGDRLVWCAGAVAQDYAALGGRVLYAGKPYSAVYERAFDLVDRLARRRVPRARILAIGDGISTDILGANRMGLDSLFIATGLNGNSLLRTGYLDIGRAQAALTAAGARATYAMTRLA